MKKIIIIVGIYMIIVVSGFHLYWEYHLHQLEAMGYLFGSIGRDPTVIYSLSTEQYNQMTGFRIIDEEYYRNDHIKFIYKQLNNFIKDEYNRYDEKDEKILKKIKKNIKYFETLKDTEYKFFFLEKGLSDNKICIYTPKEKKGYCITNYM